MREFYSIHLEDGEIFYFQNKNKARDFLWKTYIDNMSGYETDEDVEKAQWEWCELDMISGVGILYTDCFED